ncbi:MAG: hypothetical protein ABR874_17090 [Candidatus Sulfotelmatobacter sp.]|jgi:hypothetical protein
MPRHTSTDSSLKSRDATQLTSALEKKLLGYAALAAASGVGILASAPNAEGKVVYTPTHQKLPINTAFSLDVNGDGIPDFSFLASTFLGGARRETYTFNSDAGLTVTGAVQSNEVCGVNAGVSALPAGTKVGPKGKFAASHFFMGLVSATDGEPPRYYGPWAPSGGNVKDRYVGLKFVIDGETHYGWARFNVQVRQPLKGKVQAILTGYAYETVANAPIMAGDTSGTEEAARPATLGQLAAGAGGK